MELLIECARARRNDAAVRGAAERVQDWNALLESAARHNMGPLLYWSLKQVCPGVVPPAVLAQLRLQFRATGLRNIRFGAELVRLLALFRQAGLDVVPFKGPALASWLYEDDALRPMSDLDLLVRPDGIQRAVDLLSSAGYQAAYTGDPRLFRGNCEMPLCSAATGVTVDLHWALGPPCLHYALDLQGLWNRVSPVRIGEHLIHTLSRRDYLIFLCLHGAKHSWSSLHWLADIARIVDRTQVDWDGVMAEARARRASRVVSAGLLLAAEVLGACVPDGIVAAARADARLATIVAQVRSRIETPSHPNVVTWEDLAFQFNLLERGVDKAKFCWGHFDPTPADLASLPLPSSLYVAYYALRPLRLLAKHGAAGFRRPFSSSPGPLFR